MANSLKVYFSIHVNVDGEIFLLLLIEILKLPFCLLALVTFMTVFTQNVGF